MMELNLNNNPSMNNIYESKYYDFVSKNEQDISNNLYKKAKNPFETGYITRPADSSMVNGDKITLLSGNTIDAENFTHNRMQPYFGSKITQNVDTDNLPTKLEYFTGDNKNYKNKKEVEHFFENTPNMGLINGMNDASDFLLSRVVDSKIQNNTFPIKSVKVAPGLNVGYNSEGCGGFQQENINDFAIPRNIDELRSKINQKSSTFEIPFQGPSKAIDKRADVKPFDKNKPEKVYEQDSDRWIKTTGSILKNSERPEENLKDTSRINTHKDYVGITNLQDRFNPNEDYGKSSIMVYNNERELTQKETVVSNATSVIKSMIMPILDVLKLSTKEYLVESARTAGNARTQIPEKATLYDPVNHVMRTTIKETTVHDDELLNLTGPDESYTSLYDMPKTTIKETTIHDDEMLNLAGPDESYTSLYDIPKTTIKETSIHDDVLMNLSMPVNANTASLDDNMRTTNRQTLKTEDNTRNIGGVVYKVYEYDPKIIAKKTTKQTTIDTCNHQLGFLGGILEGIFGGYLNANVVNKNTQKQFTSDKENYGILGSKNPNQTDRTAAYNAEIDDTRENIFLKTAYTPGAGGKYVGIDKEDINMKSDKQIINTDYTNIGKVYQSGPVKIENENITKNIYMPNAYKNRLDKDLLSPLKDNDLNIQINPL